MTVSPELDIMNNANSHIHEDSNRGMINWVCYTTRSNMIIIEEKADKY
jgi:hypothetical protein